MTDSATHDTPIYVYDGECVLCSQAVRYVLKYDSSNPPIRFVAIKSFKGRELSARYGIDPDNPRSFIYIEDAKAHFSSDAVFEMAKRTGGPARYLTLFKWVPRPIRDWIYQRIANNRFSLFGKRDHCYLPTPENRARFVLESDTAPSSTNK